PSYLEHMMKLTGAKRAVSSWRFMEKVNHVDFGSVADQIVLLEDIRSNLTLKMKLKGLFHSFLSSAKVLKKLKLDQIDENANLVILFTSGTEAKPKGVPLSHKNVLSTIYNCFWNFHTECNAKTVI
ncbi:MAG: AMP-binding protein, partial [Candidatus Aenigmarchaeota archaeon]|nr:AMP-binding protein [Candidatus Aenigmarchaeota archaeon]